MHVRACVCVCVCVCVCGQSDLVTALIYTIQAENESFDELPSGDDYSDQHRKNDTSDDDNMTEDGEYGAEDEPITSDGSFDDDNMTEDGEYGTEDEPIASDEPFDESDDICSNSKTVVTFPLELCDRSISGNDLEIPLYDGSQTTLLQAVIKNLCWFCEHSSIRKHYQIVFKHSTTFFLQETACLCHIKLCTSLLDHT